RRRPAGTGAGLEAGPLDRSGAQKRSGLGSANHSIVSYQRDAAGPGRTRLLNASLLMTRRNTPRISFIGFGEAGQAIASGLRDAGIERIAAWDILFPEAAGARLKSASDTIGVRAASSAADAVRDSDMIVSAVTAASSLDAARSVAPHLTGNPFYLDINSVSPGRKQETARLLGERARYVDVAVVAALHPPPPPTPPLLFCPHPPHN